MQTTVADPLIGRTLDGRYRVLERIARGGMSTVYAAVDERLDRLVAVKVMSAALSADPAFIDRFTREARAAARLSHLNVVSVYDQGFDSGPSGHHVFIVMELVEGRTLRELLRERGRLDPAQAVSIMEPVLSALSVAHRAGLVHRDVKPENILLADDGVVKVADFGLARAVGSEAANRTGLMMGTVAYCAPEQLTRGYADRRSDVYAAGIVLFELVTGQTPYQGDSMNIAYQHVHSRVPAPSSRVRGIPYEIDELVVDATDSDPAGRPADASAFLAAVADARTALQLPVVPVPPRPRGTGRIGGPGAQATEMLRGRSGRQDTLITERAAAPYGAASAAVATAAAPTRMPAAPPVTPPAASPPARNPARRRKVRRTLLAVLLVLLLGAAAVYGGWWFAAGRYSRVPNVAGDPVASARAELTHAHFHVGSVSQQFSETIAAGRVIGADPAAGSRLVRGGTVTLVISRGKERFTVPSVAGRTESAARAALAAIPIQISPDATPQSSDTVKKGRVIGTSPPAGRLVRRGQSVTLIVSDGPPVLPIPSIAPNTTFDEASAALSHAGFRVVRKDQYSSDVPAGIVISSDPTGSAAKGTRINVVVSKGPQLVAVPQIPAQASLGQAEAALSQAGLSPVVRSFGDTSPDAAVLAISPKPGTQVQIGSAVTIYAI